MFGGVDVGCEFFDVFSVGVLLLGACVCAVIGLGLLYEANRLQI